MRFEDRLSKLRRQLAAKGLDGLLVSQPENRRYLSGFTGSAGYLLITEKAQVLAVDSRYTLQAAQQCPGWEYCKLAGETAKWFPGLLATAGPKRLGFEAGHVTYALYQQFVEVLAREKSPVQLLATDNIVETIRAVKEPEEVELIRKAVDLSDAAIRHVRDIIRPGMTELQLAWEIERFMRERGSGAMPFEAIVAGGPNTALPHAEPTGRPVQAGEPILFDIGASVDGYGSDLTRTICLSEPDATFKKVYDIVLGAQLTALNLAAAGMTGAEVDGFAREVIAEAGYGPAFGHGLGHGVGLVTHELPRLGTSSTDKLEDGMVFTLEPGIYIEGWGGIRIEDLAIMENGRARLLSSAPK